MNNSKATWTLTLAGSLLAVALFCCTSASSSAKRAIDTIFVHENAGVVLQADGVAPAPVPPKRTGTTASQA